MAITHDSVRPCADIAHAATGRRVVAVLGTPVSLATLDGSPGARRRLPGVMLRLAAGAVAMFARCRVWGVRAKFVIGTSLKTSDLSTANHQDFLPAALAEGRYAAAPPGSAHSDHLGTHRRRRMQLGRHQRLPPLPAAGTQHSEVPAGYLDPAPPID